MYNSLTMAQHDWGKALDTSSVEMLDEERGILACTVIVNGRAKPIIQQGTLRMILTPEIIEKLAAWNAHQQQHSFAVLRSQDEQRGEPA